MLSLYLNTLFNRYQIFLNIHYLDAVNRVNDLNIKFFWKGYFKEVQ